MYRQHLLMRCALLLIVATVFSIGFIGSASGNAVPPAATNPATNMATHDDMLTQVAAVVPGFGGMYFEPGKEDVLFVYLLNPAEKAAAEQAVSAVFGQKTIPAGGISIVQGRFGMPQLKKWYDLVTENIWSITGVVTTDLNEGKNAIEVGIKSEEAREAVEKELLRLGLPDKAFSVVVKGELKENTHTLFSSFRPVEGGIVVQRGTSDCTIGFVTTQNSNSGFVTASHCTSTPGTVNSDIFGQPLSTNQIGVETVDPGFFVAGACPAFYKCRYSDSAFVKFDSGITSSKGYIARPTGIGATTVDHTASHYVITETYTPVTGGVVSMVGSYSGLQSTWVYGTCVNTSTGDRMYLCQVETNDEVAIGGDSGGPWFKVVDVQLNHVGLAGIERGSLTNGGEIFSPFSKIKSELGIGTVCAAPFNC